MTTIYCRASTQSPHRASMPINPIYLIVLHATQRMLWLLSAAALCCTPWMEAANGCWEAVRLACSETSPRHTCEVVTVPVLAFHVLK
jgi:hypothetical protein